MDIATSQQFGLAMVKAFGLDGQRVTEMTLKLKVDQTVSLEVTKIVGFDEMQKAIHELSAYKVELTPAAAPGFDVPAPKPQNYG